MAASLHAARLPLQLDSSISSDERPNEERPPCTVTAEYTIKLVRPTPTNGSVFLSAKVVDLADDRANRRRNIERWRKSLRQVSLNFCRSEEGHPAYHRWYHFALVTGCEYARIDQRFRESDSIYREANRR